MVPYLGDFAEDATVYMPFNTFDSNDPSASVTITNLAAGDIKVHKDGAVAEIVTDGATVAINFDGITGNHLITIDTSIHADYATGSDYHVRIEGTTVDGATVNAWVGHFSIQNRYSAGALRPTTAGRTLDIQTTGEVDANLTMMGGGTQSAIDLKDFADAGYNPANNRIIGIEGTKNTFDDLNDIPTGSTMALTAGAVDQIWDEPMVGHAGADSAGQVMNDWQDAGRLDAILDARMPTSHIDATGGAVDTVTTLTGHTVQTGDTFALANGAAGFVAIDTVVDAIKVKTDFLPNATAGAAGGVFIAGTNAATTVTTSFTTTFTGNLTGSVDSVTNAVGSVTAAITLPTIPANWITAAGVADGTIDAATFAAGAIDATAIATDAIDQTKIAANSIGASELAANCITSAELATSAATKIRDEILSDSTPFNGAAMARAVDGIVLGTVTTGGSTTSIPTSSLAPAAAVTDQFKGRIVTFDNATTTTNLRGQSTDITASTSGGTLTVTALTTAPVNGDTFTIQ